jgi:hypothetical protein
VKSSRFGIEKAGHLFLNNNLLFNSKLHYATGCISKYLYREEEAFRHRRGILAHSKILMPIFPRSSIPDDQVRQPNSVRFSLARPWLLAGSHNTSTTAWGSIYENGNDISVCSYELSVLFPPCYHVAIPISSSSISGKTQREIQSQIFAEHSWLKLFNMRSSAPPDPFPVQFQVPAERFNLFSGDKNEIPYHQKS